MSAAPGFSIGLISAAAIGYEILLMRLFSITLWSHFAYMIISLALLGFGASGVFLALCRDRLLKNFPAVFCANAVAFGFMAVAAFALYLRLPYNPLELIWDARQWAWQFAVYLLFAPPFFFAANCVGLSFMRFGGKIPVIYFWDLTGAGMGASLVIAGLYVLPPERLLALLGAAGYFAAALAACSLCARRRAGWSAALAAAGLASVFMWPQPWIEPRPSEYKMQSQVLRTQGARVVHEDSGPLGRIAVVESPVIPFRHAPGMSLMNRVEPPAQLAVFVDGDGMSVMTRDVAGGRFQGAAELGYLDYLTWAAPYHLRRAPAAALALGAGAGQDVLMALYQGAETVDAVELNPQVVRVAAERFADFAGPVYGNEKVTPVIAEARGFVRRGGGAYDIIQMSLLDSFGAAAAGAGSLNESYIYTVEALDDYMARLKDGGVLSITRWLKLPPRDSLKLLATAAVALEREGEGAPQNRVAMIRSWNTVTLLLKKGRFTEDEISALREFCDDRAFDLAWYPGMEAAQANRYNVLEEPYFHEGAAALLGPDRDGFISRYKFDISPATDDRPYFFNFFRWRAAPELLAMGPQGGFALLESGYLVLFATLAQAFAVCLALVAPLGVYLARKGGAAAGPGLGRVGIYFLFLGLGFMFTEIVLIQKLILFLSHPIFAAAVTLTGLLVFAGLGSAYSGRFARLAESLRLSPPAAAAGAVSLVIALYAVALPYLFLWLGGAGGAVRTAAALAVLAPAGFLMGTPFPLGLAEAAKGGGGRIAWAWAVNGGASVLGAVCATALSIHFGFTAVLAAAAALYMAAAITFRRLQ